MSPPAQAAARPLSRSSERHTTGQRRSRPAPARGSSRRPPRRYSGPAGGIAAATAAAVAVPAVPLPARVRPARPPAPSRSRRQARPRSYSSRRAARVALPITAALSPRALLAFCLRGRVWIGVVAFALIGIVTMQLIVLRLNTNIGSSLKRAATLQREDAALSITNSEADSGERIETLAHSLGMIAVAPGELRFLPAAGLSRAGAAAQRLRSPASSSTTAGIVSGAGVGSLLASSGEGAVSGASSEGAAAAAPAQPTEAEAASTPTAGTTEAGTSAAAGQSAGGPSASQSPQIPASGGGQASATSEPSSGQAPPAVAGGAQAGG